MNEKGLLPYVALIKSVILGTALHIGFCIAGWLALYATTGKLASNFEWTIATFLIPYFLAGVFSSFLHTTNLSIGIGAVCATLACFFLWLVDGGGYLDVRGINLGVGVASSFIGSFLADGTLRYSAKIQRLRASQSKRT